MRTTPCSLLAPGVLPAGLQALRSTLAPVGALILAGLLSSGCATANLEKSRAHYFSRDPDAALAAFPAMPSERSHNSLLYLLERATILQTVSNYADSATDFLAAATVEERLRIGSISQSSGTLLVSEMTKSFSGVPFEQVLLHAFAAKNYLALGQVDDAAVEARNVVERLSGGLDGFPDSAYAHYLAGVCLELTGDRDGATIEYRRASTLLNPLTVEPETGRFLLAPATNMLRESTGSAQGAEAIPYAASSVPPDWNRELVCFLGIGVLGPARGAEWRNSHWGAQPYADIYVNGLLAGRSVPLNDTYQLHAATRSRVAAAKAAKAVVRTGVKLAAASSISDRNGPLGLLVWLLLIRLEEEDLRRWETLPRWLHAARVRCPDKVANVRVVFRRADGTVVDEQVLPPSPARSSHLTVTFARAL